MSDRNHSFENSQGQIKAAIRKRMSQVYGYLIIQAVIFFVAAGRLDIPKGWFYFGLSFFYFSISGPVVARLNPEGVSQRAKKHKGTKGFDKIFAILYAPLALALPLIAGLDVGRFGWSSMNIYYLIIGSAMFVAGSIFIQWTIVANKHFEKTVRIQVEREHEVVTIGPYGIVRHPGYVGMIISGLATPLILGSVFALIPAGVASFLLVIRTSFEDKTLGHELKGYSEYARRVRYRLVPRVW